MELQLPIKTKELKEIPGLESGAWVIIRKFKAKHIMKIQSALVGLNVDVNEVITGKGVSSENVGIKLDLAEYKMALVACGIESASFIPKETAYLQVKEIIGELDIESFDFVADEINKLNPQSMTTELKKNLPT